jgi:hypothetical protein
VLAISESFDDEGEAKEGNEDAVQFLEAGEDGRDPLSLLKRRSISFRLR